MQAVRNVITAICGVVLATPLGFAYADSGALQTSQQIATVAVALEAQIASLQNNSTVACAALFTKPQVHLGEPVVLAWGSVGAMAPGDDSSKSMWSQNGSNVVSLSMAGTWTYSFTFYAKNGGTATCTAQIVAVK